MEGMTFYEMSLEIWDERQFVGVHCTVERLLFSKVTGRIAFYVGHKERRNDRQWVL